MSDTSLTPELQDLISKSPSHEYTSNHKVACNGGGGALGHPKVWYEMGSKGYVTCQYCDKLFIAGEAA